MKNKLVTASISLLLLFFAFVCTVNAQNPELLSKGTTYTYERYHIWESNDPEATPLPDEDFFTRNNSIISIKIENVSSTIIYVQITIQNQKGTQSIDLSHNIVTGYNEPSNTIFGDSRAHAIDLIQKPQTQVNYTETRTYMGSSRQVNVFYYIRDGWTMFDNIVYNVTDVDKFCYDAQTGMFLELESKLFTYNPTNHNLNQTIQEFFILKNTNAWVVAEFPSIPFLPLLMTSVVVVVTVAILHTNPKIG